MAFDYSLVSIAEEVTTDTHLKKYISSSKKKIFKRIYIKKYIKKDIKKHISKIYPAQNKL